MLSSSKVLLGERSRHLFFRCLDQGGWRNSIMFFDFWSLYYKTDIAKSSGLELKNLRQSDGN
jgi:hypothetical protein